MQRMFSVKYKHVIYLALPSLKVALLSLISLYQHAVVGLWDATGCVSNCK